MQSRKPRATQRASSCKTSSGKTPFDLPNSGGGLGGEGLASCIPECLLQERLLRSPSLTPLNGLGSWNHEKSSQGHAGSQHRRVLTRIWATGLAWWDHNPQHHRSFCFCSFNRKLAGKASSLLWRGSTSCQSQVSSKAPGWSGIWTVQAGDRDPLSHKDFFIL